MVIWQFTKQWLGLQRKWFAAPPLVESKGNLGRVYSRDMKFAAPRYTEVKLAEISSELFKDIDKDTVDFIDNYDGTMKEPVLLPSVFEHTC